MPTKPGINRNKTGAQKGTQSIFVATNEVKPAMLTSVAT